MPAEISAAPGPLYLQVYDAITDAIHSGRLTVGDRLPTERTFCQQFGVSRATVRRALQRLVSEGALQATVGRGYFVSDGVLTEPPNTLLSFTELAHARGLRPSAQVLGRSLRPPSPEEARVFDIDLTDLVFELDRLRLLDDSPTALDRIRVPAGVVPGIDRLDFTDASIYGALEAAGAAPVTADVVVSASAADENRAGLLDVPERAPLVVCTTMSHDSRGRLVEIGEITYRADRYQFRATLRRPGRDVQRSPRT
jgi:DNA-binding GntR family transcriptional regulator